MPIVHLTPNSFLLVPITTHIDISTLNVAETVPHYRRWTKHLHFPKPLHSNEELGNFPGGNIDGFYIGGKLHIIVIFHASVKADWLWIAREMEQYLIVNRWNQKTKNIRRKAQKDVFSMGEQTGKGERTVVNRSSSSLD